MIKTLSSLLVALKPAYLTSPLSIFVNMDFKSKYAIV
jgi:hypothetical protein